MKYYLVGGAVRDQLLGYPYSERDWVVVGATPEQMLALGFKPVGKDFPVFLHPDTNEEYALARTERKSGRGYHGFVCYSSPDVTLEEDLARRDLTINAIARADDGELIDPYGGRADLEQRVLRHVAPAFAEDPLRVLRVARFAARYFHLGFRVAAETLALMRDIVASGEITHLVAERVWKEMARALLEPDPEIFFQVLRDCDALQALLPQLADAASPATWSALLRSAQTQQPAPVRFAVLCAELPAAAVVSLCEHLKTPNEFRDLAVLVNGQRHAVASADSAQRALQILEQSDALRRPERFSQFLDACRILQTAPAQIERIERARAAALTITPQPLLERGFSGKNLGEQLQRERLAAIEEIWS